MSQVFPRYANTLTQAVLVGILLLAAAVSAGLYEVSVSPYATGAGVTLLQPIPFSHQHHVGVLGFDCRYCHTSVEDSAFAGLPPTKTCMNCHSQIWVGSQMLAPVRESYRTGQPLHWNRVHNLQQFVYFDHSIHVAKGIGCATCHGRVDQMPLMRQEQPLLMKWCLDCHGHPERFVRPRDKVFDMAWQPPPDQAAKGRELVQEYHIRGPETLTNCSTCHR
jgi:hypothetical protein